MHHASSFSFPISIFFIPSFFFSSSLIFPVIILLFCLLRFYLGSVVTALRIKQVALPGSWVFVHSFHPPSQSRSFNSQSFVFFPPRLYFYLLSSTFFLENFQSPIFHSFFPLFLPHLHFGFLAGGPFFFRRRKSHKRQRIFSHQRCHKSIAQPGRQTISTGRLSLLA